MLGMQALVSQPAPPHPNPLPRVERGKHTLIHMIPAREAQRSRHAAQAPALRAGTQTSFNVKGRAALAPTRVAAALFNPLPVDWVPALRRDDDCEYARTALNAARNLTPLSP
jgi:hypothetical protein